jgi:hypothetical protein
LGVGQLELPLVDLQAGGDLLQSVVLGCDVLRACRLLFEADAGEVRFLAPRSPEEVGELLRSSYPDREFAPLDLSWTGGCPYVEVALAAGSPARFLVDTGALQTFVSERTLRASDPGRKAGDGLVGDLAIGPWRAWIAAQVADSERDDGLGFDVLSELTFLWDGPGSKLWIAAPRPGERATLAAGWGVDQILRDRGLDPQALPDAR